MSTGLGLAFVVGLLAAIRTDKAAGIQIRWHWSILVFSLAAYLWNSRLWNAIRQAQQKPTAKAKRRVVLHLAVLVVFGLGYFLYPLLFLQAGFRHEALVGTLIAAGFLCALGVLFYNVAKVFKEEDVTELQRQARASKENPPSS